MELYLFRHGIAEDAPPGESDSARELTGEGREKTAAVIKLALKSGVRPSLVVTSPYIRARQTAHIAAEDLGYLGDTVVFPSLVPHSSPEAVWQELRDHSAESAILLAGHEPLLSHLAAWLLNTPRLRIDVKKSALIRIDVASVRSAPHGIFRWMIVPKMVSER